ncbi:protein tyrosine phosphatase [Brucella sp. 191011898]|nr:protein tyrosine phosphatase [Brucella sp. 191011898]
MPYPEGTRCILLLNVSKRPCGDHSTAVVSPVQQQNTLAPNHKLIRHYSLYDFPIYIGFFKILGFNLYMRYIFRVLLMVLLNEMIRFMRWVGIIL